MVTSHEILFIVGAGAFALTAIIAAVLALIFWAWRRQFSTFIHSGIQCALMALVYALMTFDWWFKQRKDGREFPWYRDVAQVGVLFLQTWMVCVLLWLDKVDAFTALVATFCGAMALVFSNFCVANVYWFGWSAACVVLAGCTLFIALTAQRRSWRSYVVLALSLVLLIGLPLVQLLSWTMTGALDNSPETFNSEIAYLCVTYVGIALTGLAAGLLHEPQPFVPLSAPALPVTDTQPATVARPQQQQPAAPAPAAEQTLKSSITSSTLKRRYSPKRNSATAASGSHPWTVAPLSQQPSSHIRVVTA